MWRFVLYSFNPTTMIVKPIKTRIFKEGESLVDFIREHIYSIPDKSVLVVTSKIVALAEGRTAENSGPKSKEMLIRSESEAMLHTKYIHLTLKDGMIMAAAGIDASNADGRFILLPKDSFKTARMLRNKLMKAYKVRDLGILVTDSRTFPLRSGVIGLATGFAGFRGVRDYRGAPDLFGRKLKFSRTNVADCLASAAVTEMGEAAESLPLALITDARVEFTDKLVRKNSVNIRLDDDIYRPLLLPLMRKMRARQHSSHSARN